MSIAPTSIWALSRGCFVFAILRSPILMKDYFDQYLLIEAKPVSQKSEKVYTITKKAWSKLQRCAKICIAFSGKAWFLEKSVAANSKGEKRAIVWGSGSKCVGFMTTLGVKDEIQYIVDINPRRHGKFIPGAGKEIVAPEFLKQYKPDTVIVMNPIYCNEIKKMMDDMGVTAELSPVHELEEERISDSFQVLTD